MTNPPVARLAFITEPEPGTFLLNLQFGKDAPRVIDTMDDEHRYERVEITHDQLRNLATDATRMAVRL